MFTNSNMIGRMAGGKPVVMVAPQPPSPPVPPTVDCSGGDCACGPADVIAVGLVGSDLIAEDTVLCRVQPSGELILGDGVYVVYHPYYQPVVVNLSALNIVQRFAAPTAIRDVLAFGDDDASKMEMFQVIRQLVSARLLQIDASLSLSLSGRVDTLVAWLHITDRCNLRCDYCYLPHLQHDMSLEIGRAAIDATLRSACAHGYRRVSLKYAGGEPLLCWDRIAELHRYAQCQSDINGIELDGVVLTNCTRMSREIAASMCELRLRLMVSLDGIGEKHDSQRHFGDGRGSFAKVESGVSTALKEGLVPEISVTITGDSADGLPSLANWLLDRDFPFAFNFYRGNSYSNVIEAQHDEQRIIDGVLSAYDVIEQRVPARSLLGSLVDRGNLTSPHLRSCGVGQNYMVFDHRGRVSKCQMMRRESVGTVHAPDPLILIQQDKAGLQNPSVEEKEGCRDCEWKYWCTGGCSMVTFRATGRYDIKSPNCRIYKALYPRAVMLEGFRILRFGRPMDLVGMN